MFAIPPDTDFRPGTPLFNQIRGTLVGGFAPPYKTFQFAAVAGLLWNDPTELVTAALNVIGFNLRYTRNVLEHTHGHIPFDNREATYAGSFDDAALNTGIQRWTGDPDAVNYMATYYTPTGALQVPVQTLHGSRDPVVPVWHEDLYAHAAADQGAAGLLEQVVVPSFGHCNFSNEQVLAAFDRLIDRLR